MQRYRLTILSGSLFLMLILAACGGGFTTGSHGSDHGGMSGMETATTTTSSDPMTENLKGLTGKDFEIKFMQEMIVHHQSAIDMAKMVPTQTKRPELNTLSQNILTAQQKEVTDMTSWLAEWHNEKLVSDAMDVPGMMEMMGDMDKLKNASNDEFDRQFLTMMVAHYQQAVNMASLIPTRTQRAEMVKLGQDIVKTQSAEIQQMQKWKQQWFKS